MTPVSPLPGAILAGFAMITLGTATWLEAHAEQRAFLAASHQIPQTEWLFEPSLPADPAQAARGRSLFLDSCAHCHGADARGDEGPDLHDEEASDRYIASTITRGIPHEMPSFRKKLGPAEITALTAYLRSLGP